MREKRLAHGPARRRTAEDRGPVACVGKRRWPCPALSLAVVVVIVALAGCSSRLGAPEPVTREGESILRLWRPLFWTAAALGAVVLGLIAWCVVRYRARGSTDLPPQSGGNVPLELVYTAIPVAIVGVLFAMTLATDSNTATLRNRPALTVDVTAFQWQWRFEYAGRRVAVQGGPGALPELVLPAGRVVHLRLRSVDVVHSFFVPGFLTKRDAIPGVRNTIEVRPQRTGTYGGHCAEFCGLDHARMNFTVRVVTPDAFEAWVGERAQAGGGR